MSLEPVVIKTVVLVVVLGGAVSFVVAVYNGLVQVKNNVEKAFNNIDVLLQQRHDELPKLVDAAKGYMKHEQSLLTDIVKLRMKYKEASGVPEKVDIENSINGLLSRLNVLVEQYPDLKAIQSFTHIQERVSMLEEQIADRREFFNDSINIYNIRIERFPDLILAGILGYRKQDYLTVPEEKKQDVTLGFDA